MTGAARYPRPAARLRALAAFAATIAVLLLAGTGRAASQAPEHADIYVFYSRTCPHCERALAFLERVRAEEPRLRLHALEVEGRGAAPFRRAVEAFRIDRPAVPMIVIGERVMIGYGDDRISGAAIRRHLRACLAQPCRDLIKPLLDEGGGGQPQIERPPPPRKVTLPFVGEIETAGLSLLALTAVMAAVDGFNPCAMWGLVFLLGLLAGFKDRRRMWALGGVFVAVSALVYFAIMAAWLNVLLLLGALAWIRAGVAAVALAGGAYYLREFARGETVCKVTAPESRRRLLDRLRELARRRNLALAVAGVAVLAVAVNLVDLLCSAGLPAVYTEVLAQSRLPRWEYYGYLALYILIFMADDLLVFATAMTAMTVSRFGLRYTRASNLVGGIVLAALGLLLLFRPEWLVFR